MSPDAALRNDRTTRNANDPLAVWLRRVADNLETIYVRRQDTLSGRWGNCSLADLPHEEAAGQIARFLSAWPFVPHRLLRTEGEKA